MSTLIHNGRVYGLGGFNLTDMIEGTLKANETEVTFTNPLINKDSVLEPFVDDSVFGKIYPTAMVVNDGNCVVTYNEAPEEDTLVAVNLIQTSKYKSDEAQLLGGLTNLLSATLTTSETELVFEDSAINENSIIDYYYWSDLGVEAEPVSYATTKVEAGKVTLTFDALEADLKVGIRVM